MHPDLQISVISLAHRHDRHESITTQADQLGIDITIFPAINGAEVDPGRLDQKIARNGPLGEMGPGIRACTLSHMELISEFLDGQAKYCLVLEDDAQFAADTPGWLQNLDWIPADADVVKIEAFELPGLVILLGPDMPETRGRKLAKSWSRNTGGCGYILSRTAAKKIMQDNNLINVPIDHYLFNANVSKIAADLTIYQMYPALIRQAEETKVSEVQKIDRKEMKKWDKMKREVVRGWYEIRRLPVQLWQLLFKGGHLKTIEFKDRC